MAIASRMGAPRGREASALGAILLASLAGAFGSADAQEPAEIDDGGVDLAVPADDDVYNPSHVLAGIGANSLAENGRDLPFVENHRRCAPVGIEG